MGRHPGTTSAYGAGTAAATAARSHQHFHSACARRDAHPRTGFLRAAATADGNVPAAAGATRAATLRPTAATAGRNGAPAGVLRACTPSPRNIPNRAAETGRTGGADTARCGADLGREACVPASNLGWHTYRSAPGTSSCTTQARRAATARAN
jgi:hypothetical protein